MNPFIHNKLLAFFVKTKGLFSKPLLGGLGHVFMLHRVLPEAQKNTFSYNRSLAITPEGLERWIKYFKHQNYSFISLDTLHQIGQKKLKLNQKFICFTLDDGYKDNLTYALPIFEKHQMPFTIYITSCFPNQEALYWWYLLEHHFNTKKSITLVSGNYNWSNEEEATKIRAQVREEVKKYTLQAFLNLINTELIESVELNKNYQKTLALSWLEIEQLAQHPLCTIGAHTSNHLSLAHQNKTTAFDEIKNNKIALESCIKKPVKHFAYPYGALSDAKEREWDFLKQLGFDTAVYNHPGNVFSYKNRLDCYKIPRMGLTDETAMERIQNIQNGIFHFSTNGLKKIIA